MRRHSLCTTSPGIARILSFLTSLAWLIVELPFAVRIEDGTPVPIEALHIAHFTGCDSIAKKKKKECRIVELAGKLNDKLTCNFSTLALTNYLMHAKVSAACKSMQTRHQLLAKACTQGISSCLQK